MAKVIGFEEEDPKIATCPTCKAIIAYTNSDMNFLQLQSAYLTCPNCGKWVFL